MQAWWHSLRTRFEDLEKVGLNKSNNEWVQGYGYQMWMCRHNAYRADGFAGQYIMVFPDRDAVLVLTTSFSLYQPLSGRQCLRDSNNHVLGYYEPSRDQTVDSNYHVIGNGNLLTTLL